MSISIFDIFKIGIGPSSSHTMGPMRAARLFVQDLEEQGLLNRIARVSIDLYGSLALTGKGHCTARAVLMGLEGATPETVDPEAVNEKLVRIRSTARLHLAGGPEIDFDESKDTLTRCYLPTPMGCGLRHRTNRERIYHPRSSTQSVEASFLVAQKGAVKISAGWLRRWPLGPLKSCWQERRPGVKGWISLWSHMNRPGTRPKRHGVNCSKSIVNLTT